MILENKLDLPGDPDTVFALLNDVERVAGCLPGAVLEGRDGESYLGKVKFKVGPVSAAYAGKVRFTEIAAGERRLRLSARGADSHGNGDAEADVTLTLVPGPQGSSLSLHTDLVVRGKIAQFGKGAISTVSNRILQQFAQNLGALLENGGSASVAAPPAPAPAPASDSLDGLAMLLPPNAKRYAAIAAAGALGLFQGWLLGRIRSQNKLIKELLRDRA
ncbi:SRPBCC family protein [Amycolatopsis benzoatilytica]|uniref:SRPBCC family protein n=1 Tax=Amycolatopsis benzoatilytica TaxID=346045 RepID=UPI0003693D7D|nr:SRPBCC family protein [Amycolatopsis benzoatilytica]